METQQIISELESLRDSIGQHMQALDSMSDQEQRSTFLGDLERVKQLTKRLEETDPA